jgi:cytoskeletal protein CcmA (bactofilin family)
VWKKEESKLQGVAEISTTPVPSATAGNPNAPILLSANAPACISQGIRIKGEITGREDLFIDGAVEGKLDLGSGSVTIGPNGKVKAEISAREVTVRGELVGKIVGRERVQLWSTGRVEGEVQTEQLTIEEGAVFRGRAEAGKPQPKAKEAQKVSSNPGGGAVANTMAAGSGTATD